MFDKILEAYKNGDKNLFEARVRNLFDADLPCTFEAGSEEWELYAKAALAHKRWRGKGISSRYAKVQMVEYAYEIAKILSEKKEEKKKKPAEPVKEVVLEEPIHMTGVVPEKAHFFKKKVKDNEGK